MVVIAGRSRHGGVGRYHRDPACWTLDRPARQRQRRERRLADAVAEGYWECSQCCEPPVCCAQGQHGASYALPMLPIDDEAPAWEQEEA
jgi:hypothetical protein